MYTEPDVSWAYKQMPCWVHVLFRPWFKVEGNSHLGTNRKDVQPLCPLRRKHGRVVGPQNALFSEDKRKRVGNGQT